MYTDMGSPPIIEYEKVVHPVTMITRVTALNKRDQKGNLKDGRKRKRHEGQSKEKDDKLFEPFVGKLFDYSA